MSVSLSLRPIPYRLYQTPKLAFIIDISYSMSTFSFGLVIRDNWEVQGLGVGILNSAWLLLCLTDLGLGHRLEGRHSGGPLFFNRFVTVYLSQGFHSCPGHAEEFGALQNLRLIRFCSDHSSPAALRGMRGGGLAGSVT